MNEESEVPFVHLQSNTVLGALSCPKAGSNASGGPLNRQELAHKGARYGGYDFVMFSQGWKVEDGRLAVTSQPPYLAPLWHLYDRLILVNVAPIRPTAFTMQQCGTWYPCGTHGTGMVHP